MTRELRILRRAISDIDESYLWLRQRSANGAIAWHEALIQRLNELADGPFLGSAAPEGAVLKIDLRHVFFKTRRGRTYRILFLVVGDEIRVLRVRGPGQRPVKKRDIPSEE